MNFYSINCYHIREDNIGPDFFASTYADRKSVISSKNYKSKKSIEVMLPMLFLKLFQSIRIPNKLQFFTKEVNIEINITNKITNEKIRT